MPLYLDIIGGPAAGTGHMIDGSVTVGRGRSADLVIDDPTVSREHASLSIQGMTMVIHDLGSSNGVLVNGSRLEDARRLGAGDLIQLGATKIKVRLETTEPDESTPTDPTVLHLSRSD